MIVDTDVPIAGFMTIFACLSCIVQAIFLCISAPYIVAGVPVFLGTFYLVQRFYLKTSRQLRVLDIEAKAPLISHFLDTMRGLTTIRAHGSRPAFEQRFLEMLDLSQRPFYLLCTHNMCLRAGTRLTYGYKTAYRSGLVSLLRCAWRPLPLCWSALPSAFETAPQHSF